MRFSNVVCLLLCLSSTGANIVAKNKGSKSTSSTTLESDESMEMDQLASFVRSTMNDGGRDLFALDNVIIYDGRNKDDSGAPGPKARSSSYYQVTEDNGGVKYTKCEDISEIYRSVWNRRYNGTNILNEHYDCVCSDVLPADTTDYYEGELGTVAMSCTLKETLCYDYVPYDTLWNQFVNASKSGTEVGIDPNQHDDSVEICVKTALDFTVWVNTTTSDTVTTPIVAPTPKRNKGCTEFVQGGPKKIIVQNDEKVVGPGSYCTESSPFCFELIRGELEFTTEGAVEICNNRMNCLDFFQTQQGYTSERALAMCPITMLNEEECQVSVNSYNPDAACEALLDEADGLGLNIHNHYITITLADCANILPCAKSSCALSPRYDAALEDTLGIFPECTNHTLEIPTNDNDAEDDDDETSTAFVMQAKIGMIMSVAAVLMAGILSSF